MPPVAAASTPAPTDRSAREIADSDGMASSTRSDVGVQRVTDAAQRVRALGQLTHQSDLLDHLPGVGDDPGGLVRTRQSMAPG